MATEKGDLSSGDYYFDSYAHFGIHEEMLKDEVRTMAYRNAIYRNRHLFEGKVVLDIGCGTGILSMFAATAGARLVIGVDMSGIIEQAKVIVAANGLQDKVVLLRGKMEEVQLPVDKVDIIISEWMGYFLLYESMLDTVLYARDRYLATDGVILPNRSSMVITAIEDAQYKEEKIHFWDNVYGFDMSSIKSWALREPLVDVVESRSVVGNEFVFKSIDIATVKKEDLAFSAPFSIKMQRSDYVHALLAYFTIDFDVPGMSKAVRFGTGPFDKYTHWKQTVFYLPNDIQVSQGDLINGTLKCTPNARNPRDLDISISYERCDAEGKKLDETFTSDYHMC
jgi:protein arginine N-methyltransferase 1